MAGGFDGLRMTSAGGFDGLQGEHPRSIKSCFSGFIHFPRKRTLSGWALLFAMGKHTSKEFLYGRKHSRISKCRKTGTKVRSKSGPKTGPSRCPKHRKHRYTGKSSLQRGLKKGVQNRTQIAPKSHPNRIETGHETDVLVTRDWLDKLHGGNGPEEEYRGNGECMNS
jgi:hypothetical protein